MNNDTHENHPKKSTAALNALRFLSLFPYVLVVVFARALAALAGRLPLSIVSAHRDIVINLMMCFPEKSYSQVLQLSRQVLKETAHTLAGYSHIWLRPLEQTFSRVSAVRGADKVKASLDSDRPVLFISLHQSFWEVPVLELGRLGKTVVMYQPAEGDALDPVVKVSRERTGCELVPANGVGVKAAMKAMSKSGAFGLLADHQPGGKQNPFANFFGYQVQAPGFVHKVAQKYQPDIYYISALRPNKKDIEVIFEPADESMKTLDEPAFLNAMMAGIERIIRRAPEQYNWTYSRFRRSPEGKRRWYKKAVALDMIARRKAGEPIEAILADQ